MVGLLKAANWLIGSAYLVPVKYHQKMPMNAVVSKGLH